MGCNAIGARMESMRAMLSGTNSYGDRYLPSRNTSITTFGLDTSIHRLH